MEELTTTSAVLILYNCGQDKHGELGIRETESEAFSLSKNRVSELTNDSVVPIDRNCSSSTQCLEIDSVQLTTIYLAIF
jgi:hypothetical protein